MAKKDETAGDKRAKVGHNSGEMLKSYIERIERIETEQDDLANDKKEIYVEVKANGFDTKILRKVIAIRKRDKAEYETEKEMIDLYLTNAGGVFG